MLRNWSERIPSGPAVGLLVSGIPTVGWLGSEILELGGDGDAGGTIWDNDGIDPGKLYRALVITSTFAPGTLVLDELGGGFVPDSGIATLELYEDNLYIGQTTLTGIPNVVQGTMAWTEQSDDQFSATSLAPGVGGALLAPSMLRNWTERIPLGPMAGTIVSGTQFVGLLGADILEATAEGDNGGGAFQNDDLTETYRYRLLVTSTTYPAGQFILGEAGDGQTPLEGGATLEVYENNALIGTVTLGTVYAVQGALSFTETGDDVFSASGSTGAIVTGRLAFVEPGDDLIAFSGTVHPPATSFFAFFETGDDAFSARGTVDAIPVARLSFTETGDDAFSATGDVLDPATSFFAFFETGDDTFSATGAVQPILGARLAFVETTDDTFSATIAFENFLTAILQFTETGDDTFAASGQLVGAGPEPAAGTLAALAQDYSVLRAASGLMLDPADVLRCAIDAARFYAGWATFEDPSARYGPFSVTGATLVTSDEWGIIAPLFRLYVERESAIVVEATRAQGVELVGRDSSTVAADIAQYERDLPKLAFYEEPWSVGFPDDV